MLQEYEVYFEFFGKKMKSKVLANSIEQAKEQILDKVNFHKVEAAKDSELNDAINGMNEVIDALQSLKELKEKLDTLKKRT
ncbi:hypothetical protein [Mongoliibacter ruber]|uniref:Uncharacterized protein n=1 Tax=Mongoliibacter ruber TaxID=1750599 RepID=A0A2T0WV82_9BACT|nr:hypothetical protein [Mongoliibacter ruber]PRY90602.1 hypothetical protein CLW00_101266 [Mongoliibacter ruber]